MNRGKKLPINNKRKYGIIMNKERNLLSINERKKGSKCLIRERLAKKNPEKFGHLLNLNKVRKFKFLSPSEYEDKFITPFLLKQKEFSHLKNNEKEKLPIENQCKELNNLDNNKTENLPIENQCHLKIVEKDIQTLKSTDITKPKKRQRKRQRNKSKKSIKNKVGKINIEVAEKESSNIVEKDLFCTGLSTQSFFQRKDSSKIIIENTPSTTTAGEEMPFFISGSSLSPFLIPLNNPIQESSDKSESDKKSKESTDKSPDAQLDNFLFPSLNFDSLLKQNLDHTFKPEMVSTQNLTGEVIQDSLLKQNLDHTFKPEMVSTQNLTGEDIQNYNKSSNSKQYLNLRSKEWLNEMTESLAVNFNISTNECVDTLKRNKYNILTSLHELETYVRSSLSDLL